MQPPEQLMVRVAEVCNRLRLPYFVTGSVASIAYGEPRFTQDVDIVVELPSWNVGEFCEAFPAPDYYVSPEAAMAAAQGPGQFNIIWVPEGVKADIMVFSDTPFNESRLGRARKLTLPGGGEIMFSAPEDVILKKLEFFREGASDKHLRDIASMLKVSGPEIDLDYIAQWAPRLGVTEEWAMMKQRLAIP